jgi:hypothetical protein
MDAPSSTFFALASSVPHEKAASPAPKLRQSQYSKPVDTRQTLYRHVSPDGALREDGRKLLERLNG